MIVIGVLVPTWPGPPTEPPERRPIGRAALALQAEGITAVMGDTVVDGRIRGHRALPGRWVETEVEAAAFYDRFPSQRRAGDFAAIVENLGGRPLGNSPGITALCRDKLLCQRFLEARGVEQPEVEADPQRFEERLRAWGAGFLKPRYGALGAGVRRVVPGDPLPARIRALTDDDEPAILQRAVPPPPGLAGRSVRVLVQRQPDGAWRQLPAVVRQSADDPVVNAARGAEVRLADDLLAPAARAAMAAMVQATCAALSAHPEGDLALELGVDLVLDGADRPHLVEVNSRPRGRLEKLAILDPIRFGPAHLEACTGPIRTLAARHGSDRPRRG